LSSGLPPFIDGEIWRVHPDGSGYERVGLAGSASIADRNPTPSPDGTQVAYASTRGLLPGFASLRVLTIAGGTETDLSLEASYPRWSPTGTWIAFTQFDESLNHGAVWLVHPDGSEAHRVYPDSLAIGVGAGLAWSPDGKYLIAVDGVGMMLLDLEGNHVRLPATKGNAFPSWKP
jgi:Tol biopolymer transport system component